MVHCCSVLHCVAVYMGHCVAVYYFSMYVALTQCSMLHCVTVAVCCSVLNDGNILWRVTVCCSMLQCLAVCCSVLQCVALRLTCGHRVFRGCAHVCMCEHVRVRAMVWCGVGEALRLRYVFGAVAVICSVLQCVAVCCSVLQCVAVCCSKSMIFLNRQPLDPEIALPKLLGLFCKRWLEIRKS